jgi:hypothetical protein
LQTEPVRNAMKHMRRYRHRLRESARPPKAGTTQQACKTHSIGIAASTALAAWVDGQDNHSIARRPILDRGPNFPYHAGELVTKDMPRSR